MWCTINSSEKKEKFGVIGLCRMLPFGAEVGSEDARDVYVYVYVYL